MQAASFRVRAHDFVLLMAGHSKKTVSLADDGQEMDCCSDSRNAYQGDVAFLLHGRSLDRARQRGL